MSSVTIQDINLGFVTGIASEIVPRSPGRNSRETMLGQGGQARSLELPKDGRKKYLRNRTKFCLFYYENLSVSKELGKT